MLSKFFLFSILLYLTRSPLIAVIVFLVILYMLERRYIGLLPSVVKPIQRLRRISRLKEELRANPHASTSRFELARIYVQQKKYQSALKELELIETVLAESADYRLERGICHIRLGELEAGCKQLEAALTLNPRVGYGAPYLYLAEGMRATEPEQALAMLEQFKLLNSSSCEAYYRQGLLYQQLGRKEEAHAAFRETGQIYRMLPKYTRRKQRRWALLARLHK